MKRPELLIENGEFAGRRYQVGEAGLRLGRSSSNDIQIVDEELSRNHCMFEIHGEDGIRLTDLASANGTRVNGAILGSEAVDLKPGDAIEVGGTLIRVVPAGGEAPAAASAAGGVDLGLGSGAGSGEGLPAGGQQPAKRRSPVMNVIWAAVAALLAVSIYLVLGGFGGDAGDSPVLPVEEPEERVVEMRYEKVVATSQSIFRYYMSLSSDGALRIIVDDVPGENRHVDQTRRLDEKALERLGEILLDPDLMSLDRQYVGPDVEPPELRSWELAVVLSSRVRRVSIVNTQEPEAFRRVREKLETFTKNELGVWAIQCSRAQLEEMAAECAETGLMKWDDRDVEYGNLDASVRAYREAVQYLDTLNPKPPEFAEYREGMERARKELDRRYADQRFKADRALNLSDWETAAAELKILCQMVPDREDDRYREAAAKLVDVEQRLKNGGR